MECVLSSRTTIKRIISFTKDCFSERVRCGTKIHSILSHSFVVDLRRMAIPSSKKLHELEYRHTYLMLAWIMTPFQYIKWLTSGFYVNANYCQVSVYTYFKKAGLNPTIVCNTNLSSSFLPRCRGCWSMKISDWREMVDTFPNNAKSTLLEHE